MANGTSFGRSLLLVDGDVAMSGGDLLEIGGRDNLLQTMQVILDTPTATDVFNINYGFDYVAIFSAPTMLSTKKELIRLNIVKSLSFDDRIREIKDVVFDDEARFQDIARQEGGDAARTRHVTERRWTCVVVVVTLDGEQRILALEGATAP